MVLEFADCWGNMPGDHMVFGKLSESWHLSALLISKCTYLCTPAKC